MKRHQPPARPSPRARTALRCRQWLTRPNSEPFDHTTTVSKAGPRLPVRRTPTHPSVSSTTRPTERGEASLIAASRMFAADPGHRHKRWPLSPGPALRGWPRRLSTEWYRARILGRGRRKLSAASSNVSASAPVLSSGRPTLASVPPTATVSWRGIQALLGAGRRRSSPCHATWSSGAGRRRPRGVSTSCRR